MLHSSQRTPPEAPAVPSRYGEQGATMRNSVNRPRALLSSLLAASTLSACSSWHTQRLTPAQVIAEQHPRAVRIGRADGNRLVLGEPQVTVDSLVGNTGGGRASVALADIREIAVRRGDPGKTIGLMVLSALAAAAALFGILIDRAVH